MPPRRVHVVLMQAGSDDTGMPSEAAVHTLVTWNPETSNLMDVVAASSLDACRKQSPRTRSTLPDARWPSGFSTLSFPVEARARAANLARFAQSSPRERGLIPAAAHRRQAAVRRNIAALQRLDPIGEAYPGPRS